MYIGGLDIGTTGCKLTVFDKKGTQVDRAYRDYPVRRATGAHEIDANAILEGVFAVITDIAKKYPNIAGIGITSFGETFVATDKEGKPLYPSMLYTDPRGSVQVGEICARIPADRSAGITGIKPHEMYSLPKLMWLKANEPEVFAKISYVFLVEDFVVYHLCGERKIDYSLASRTMGFDIRELKWSSEMFDAAGIDMSIMSEPVPAGTLAGTINVEITAKTGLSRDTKIACISHDQVAAAVGAGVFSSDTAVDGAGTVECITPVYDGIPDMSVMTKGNFAVVPYVIPGKYVCYAFSYTGGALIQWATDTLARKEKEDAKSRNMTVNEYLENLSESPTGLMILPHFAGAATPYMDTGSKGVMVGLTTDTSVAEIYRGCMEGVVYEMVLNMEYLKPSGVKIKKLHATGGGAHSKEWMQMKADMLNVPIVAMETVDAGTVGSAMLTGIAVGLFKDLKEASDIMVHPVMTYEPRTDMNQKYMKIYENYAKLYAAIRPLISAGD